MSYGSGSGDVVIQGFSDAQNAQMAELAYRLGKGGLSTAEQSRIQGRMDKYAAAVPIAERTEYVDRFSFRGSEIWGARLGLLGLGMVAVGVPGFIAWVRY